MCDMSKHLREIIHGAWMVRSGTSENNHRVCSQLRLQQASRAPPTTKATHTTNENLLNGDTRRLVEARALDNTFLPKRQQCDHERSSDGVSSRQELECRSASEGHDGHPPPEATMDILSWPYRKVKPFYAFGREKTFPISNGMDKPSWDLGMCQRTTEGRDPT